MLILKLACILNNLFFRAPGRKRIDLICRGFFEDQRHLSNHFEYITDCPALSENIQKNLGTFLADMELYLSNIDNSLQFSEQLKNISLVCEVEFNGSTTFRDLHILVKNV